MPVYFLKAGDLVKIGHADDVEKRVSNIAASFSIAVELVAQCDGGRETELAFHRLLQDSRSNGEWFSPSPILDAIIDRFSGEVSGRRFFGGRPDGSASSASTDQRVARKLMARLFTDASLSVAKSLEAAFQRLSSHNPEWTRRRVRSIWNMEASRIDFFEIRDLLHVAGISPADLAEWIAPELIEDEGA
jgi:hypothetical protein